MILLTPDEAERQTWSLGTPTTVDASHVVVGDGKAWSQLRTLHPVDVDDAASPADVVAKTSGGRPCWWWARRDVTDLLVVGTNLGSDLVRYRQGNPAHAAQRPTDVLWGIGGERPNYLFESPDASGSRHERAADWWMGALVDAVATRLGVTIPALLPDNAPGVVVVTGDDDQAHLEKYRAQLDLLGEIPITYFLHPLTRHTGTTLREMGDSHVIELGLHPDALEAPDRYADLFAEQAAWFERLTGRRATLVRNHGYLNDGYWGHLPVWLEHGIQGNANLPGVDGTVLNGSLLPARMTWDGVLSPHWSILTSIGDGVRFALGMNELQSAQCVETLAEDIISSGVPGAIVLNLHPQNVSETSEMHRAVRRLVYERRFAAMTLGGCIEWFAEREQTLAS